MALGQSFGTGVQIGATIRERKQKQQLALTKQANDTINGMLDNMQKLHSSALPDNKDKINALVDQLGAEALRTAQLTDQTGVTNGGVQALQGRIQAIKASPTAVESEAAKQQAVEQQKLAGKEAEAQSPVLKAREVFDKQSELAFAKKLAQFKEEIDSGTFQVMDVINQKGDTIGQVLQTSKGNTVDFAGEQFDSTQHRLQKIQVTKTDTPGAGSNKGVADLKAKLKDQDFFLQELDNAVITSKDIIGGLSGGVMNAVSSAVDQGIALAQASGLKDTQGNEQKSREEIFNSPEVLGKLDLFGQAAKNAAFRSNILALAYMNASVMLGQSARALSDKDIAASLEQIAGKTGDRGQIKAALLETRRRLLNRSAADFEDAKNKGIEVSVPALSKALAERDGKKPAVSLTPARQTKLKSLLSSMDDKTWKSLTEDEQDFVKAEASKLQSGGQ